MVNGALTWHLNLPQLGELKPGSTIELNEVICVQTLPFEEYPSTLQMELSGIPTATYEATGPSPATFRFLLSRASDSGTQLTSSSFMMGNHVPVATLASADAVSRAVVSLKLQEAFFGFGPKGSSSPALYKQLEDSVSLALTIREPGAI